MYEGTAPDEFHTLALVVNSNAMPQIKAYGVDKDMFTVPVLRRIFETYERLYSKNMPLDIETVGTELLDRKDADAINTLTSFAIEGARTPNSSYFVERLIATHIARSNKVELSMLASALDESHDPDDIERARCRISSLVQRPYKVDARGEEQKITAVLDDTLHDIEKNILAQIKNEPLGISTGIKKLDQMIYGWQKKKLYILAARPSVGKTTLAINFLHSAAAAGKRAALFTLEMGREEIGKKLISLVGRIDYGAIMRGDMTEDEADRLTHATKTMDGHKVLINENNGTVIDQLESECRRLVITDGLDIVIIDYLQLMRLSRQMESRQFEVSEISQRLKNLARELDIPIIALSQLNRAIERRADQTPTLSDLRDSGSIEQDADVVMFLYRGEMPNEKKGEDNNGAKDKATTGPQIMSDYHANIIIGKNRSGMIGFVQIDIDMATNYMGDWR